MALSRRSATPLASLPASRAWVSVGPPLSCKGLSNGSGAVMSPLTPSVTQVPSLSRLCPSETIIPAQSAPRAWAATIVLLDVTVPLALRMPPPWPVAWFPLIVP